MARLAATSRITAHQSAIKLDFSISHDRNSVLILCIIVVAVFFGQGSSSNKVCVKHRTNSGAKRKKLPNIL